MSKIHTISAFAGALALTLPLAASAQTTLRLGHFGSGPDPFSQSVETFATRVAEASGGSLSIQIFPSGQLGNEAQQISALQGGLQDLLITSTTNLANMSAAFSLLDLPFAFSNHSEAAAVTMVAIGDQMMSGLDGTGLMGLALWENGFRALTNSVRPVNSVEDLAGMKIRVIGAPVFIETFTALGANPVPMPFPELYAAMETGTVDGQDNPALAARALRFYEVQDHYTATNHIYGAMIVLGSEAALSRLSDDDRATLARVAREFGAEQRAILRAADASAVDSHRPRLP